MAEKIIFISNFVGNGGAGRVMSLIANYFAGQHIDVTICSFLDAQEKYQLNHKIKIILIKPETRLLFLKKILRILMLRKVFKKNPGAVIISFEYFVNMQTILAALFLKNKVIISERNDPKQQDKRILMKKARDILYHLADVLVCQTYEAKNYFSKQIRKKAIVIPNPISADLPGRYQGIRKKEIVSFCRLEPQKNIKMTIDAFYILQKEYPDYKLIIYGDGSEREKLIHYVSQLNLTDKVQIYGFTFHIHNLVNDCSMFVSSSDYEGLSNSMLEAMGMGLPVIVTDCPCGGARMFIRSYENGILIPIGDTIALYQAMKYIIQNPDKAEKISEEAIKIKEKLAADKIYRNWRRIL
jgi:glycosyltransferase involved in cell wall biosynthesis